MPQMIPAAAMLSSYMPKAASCENSRNGDPGSSSARTRSRGSSLPLPVWRLRVVFPPPPPLRARPGARARHPARLRFDPLKPVAHIHVRVPVDADFLGPEQIAAQRKVGDGQTVADDVSPSREVRVENAPRRFGTAPEFGNDGRIRILRER